MKQIAEFMKVSYEEYEKEILKLGYSSLVCKDLYDAIILPKRATKGSAGYDFKIPFSIVIKPNETKLIPTGIRVKMVDGWVLLLIPRSSLGFKYRLQLNNTVGVIDSDYFNSDNQGHIMLKVTNDTNENKTLELQSQQAICQGIFMEFGITINDECSNSRNGGFGSTD